MFWGDYNLSKFRFWKQSATFLVLSIITQFSIQYFITSLNISANDRGHTQFRLHISKFTFRSYLLNKATINLLPVVVPYRNTHINFSFSSAFLMKSIDNFRIAERFNKRAHAVCNLSVPLHDEVICKISPLTVGGIYTCINIFQRKFITDINHYHNNTVSSCYSIIW